MFLLIAAAGPWLCDATGAPPWREEFLLIDRAGSTAPVGSRIAAGEAGVAPDSPLGRFLAAETFENWTLFEDEHLRFEHPAFPGMKVELSTPEEPKRIPIYGQPLRSAARAPATIYRITVGGITWALLFLQKAGDLDRGICFCGAVVVETLLPHDGALYAYSLLETGELKSMQALGDGWRVQLFEWTHSPLTQPMFLALAESIVLKHPHARSEEEWRDFSLQSPTRRDDALFGWLRRGMKTAEVLALLGQPTRQTKSELSYEKINKEFLSKYTRRVPLRDGAFEGFTGDCWKYEEIPPDRGTRQWALQLTERLGETPFKKRSKRFQQDARLAVKKFLAEAPHAENESWNRWCHVISDLAEIGLREPRVIPLVEQRFLEPTTPMSYGAWVLKNYEVAGREELFKKRLRLAFDDAGRAPGEDELFHPLRDTHNLLSFVGAKERVPFVREGLRHPHAAIRKDAAYFLDSLPTEEAHAAALRGLEDENEHVRDWSARALAQKLATAEDAPLLEAKLRGEKSESVRAELGKALERSKR